MNDLLAATSTLRARYDRLWLAEHLSRTLTRRGRRIAERRMAVHADLVAIARAAPAAPRDIDRRRDLDPDTFRREYLDRDVPVVLEQAAAGWPCVDRWTPSFFAGSYGQQTVRMLQIAPGQEKVPGQKTDVSYADIADSMNRGGDLYSRFSGLLHQHPELIDDVDVDWFRRMRHDHHSFENFGFFMGGAGTATGLHCSIAPNLFLEVQGTKRWWIFPAATAPFFAPPVKRSPYFYSLTDVSDLQSFPEVAALPGHVCDLEPGDVLFVPSFAWHQVRNLTGTVAVGYRWMSPRMGIRNSLVQTLLAATCTNPPPWRAKGHTDLPTLLDDIDF